MGKFLNGLFVGVGIGLLIAPQKGEETRRLIMERVDSWRNSTASEDDQHFAIDAHEPQITSFPVKPTQPVVAPTIQPREEKTTSTSSVSTQATPDSQYAENADNILNSANIVQNAFLPKNERIASSVNLDQQTSAETSSGDSENTAKLPTLPNRPNTSGQGGNRKSSSGTSNSNKNRGNRS